jgi:VIT1/CCC1 family predicted Fe2+/Mn2+ transporter
MKVDEAAKSKMRKYQRNEITEYHIYRRLAKIVKGSENKKILERIAEDEMRHYKQWRTCTNADIKPNMCKVWWYYFINIIFGFTFGIKLMEGGEEAAQIEYREVCEALPELQDIVREEHEHENALISLLDEERLKYTGSIVLGLNDALVELTGALAGFTFAFQNSRLVALTGLITGVAAALSMGASEYISTKTEDTFKNPFKASLYTTAAYIIAVVILVLPYLLFSNSYACLAMTLTAAVLIIAFFNYYISVAKDVDFKTRFFEMSGLSLGVAAISFLAGYLLRATLGVEI